MGSVPVNGVQRVPLLSCTSHAQLFGGSPGGTCGAGSGLVSLSTNVEVEFVTVGFMPQRRLLVLFGSWKHGSLMLLPTVQRHASLRNGAAMEFVQQEPFSTGVELAGCGGTYAMICVAGVAGGVCEEVEVVWFGIDGLIGREPVKNCPTPKSTISTRTTTTIILFFLFMVLDLCYINLKV